jgi:hypothetical protein
VQRPRLHQGAHLCRYGSKRVWRWGADQLRVRRPRLSCSGSTTARPTPSSGCGRPPSRPPPPLHPCVLCAVCCVLPLVAVCCVLPLVLCAVCAVCCVLCVLCAVCCVCCVLRVLCAACCVCCMLCGASQPLSGRWPPRVRQGGFVTFETAAAADAAMRKVHHARGCGVLCAACCVLHTAQSTHSSTACCYGGRSGGVFGTLTYPHLILPYLAYYGHLAVHCGGPWCPPYTLVVR